MQLLLDTQIFIWFAIRSARLTLRGQQLIRDAANTIYVSHISFFEIAIKQKIGKLSDLTIPTQDLIALSEAHGFSVLPITPAHIAAYDHIPLFPEHRDPFDRLLLAIALSDGPQIVSADGHFPQYAPQVAVIVP